MKKKPKLETAIWIMFITMIILYIIGARMIFTGVQRYANEAKAEYGGDHVGALIALVEDESASFEKRNSAIWALGQIGSERALPTLRELDTDEVQLPPTTPLLPLCNTVSRKRLSRLTGFLSHAGCTGFYDSATHCSSTLCLRRQLCIKSTGTGNTGH
ncbi:HEAT repeat domain-containing protein [Verrucomicrobia bacterium S94]|nr:HEAT repeat domain-containing protein [Verrucomicrobia bacterium S94]